jgi:8-oxo-dGTP diphosphatase
LGSAGRQRLRRRDLEEYGRSVTDQDRSPGAAEELPSPRHIVVATGLVRDSAGRVVLVRNERGWEMPGGQVELGEDPITALEREVMEEAGCEIKVGRLFGVYANVSTHLVILAFDCSYAAGEIHHGAECTDAAWFAPESAVAAAAHTPAAERIRDGLSRSDGVVFRSYERTPSGVYQVIAERRI